MGIGTTGTVGDGDKFLSPCSSLLENYRRTDTLTATTLHTVHSLDKLTVTNHVLLLTT